MSTTISIPSRKSQFLPTGFKLTEWEEIEPYYTNLLERPIHSIEALEKWINDWNEIDAFVSEAFAWRYIRISVDSSDQEAADLYQKTVKDLSPKIAQIVNQLNRKLVESPFTKELDSEKYFIHLRAIKNAVQLFQENNLPLLTEVQLRSKEYGKIFSEMTIGVNGKQMTLQKAGTLLEETNRQSRESVYHKINRRILQDTEALEDLFDELLAKRHQMALNAGFQNFRDFKFQALGRFDYSVEDCYNFHDSIEAEILPLVDQFNEFRKSALQLGQLRPWDLNVDTSGESPLRPFRSIEELTQNTTRCLKNLHPLFGEIISTLDTSGHLDLASRKGKRPGGYNMPLLHSGLPFIFMNATKSFNDMRTLLHESGHAIHSVLTSSYKLNSARRFPSEIAELAAMTMELLSMDHWNVFFPNKHELKRARINQLENVLRVLPWIATIDKFQHWVYTNPNHSREERKENWLTIFRQFSSKKVNFQDLEQYAEYLWHKQLHIFEVPFYYIEYGMAQLGAIAIWKQYRSNPEQTIQNYIDALKLGYTKPIKTIYETAGISFDFSKEYVSQLGAFVKQELEAFLVAD